MTENFQNFDSWLNVARTGNYLIKSPTDGEIPYFAVKPADGSWSLVYRTDHPMYAMIQGFIDDAVSGEWLDTAIHLQAMTMNCIPDTQFIAEFSKSYLELVQRMHPGYSDDDAEVLRDDEQLEEFEERLSAENSN